MNRNGYIVLEYYVHLAVWADEGAGEEEIIRE